MRTIFGQLDRGRGSRQWDAGECWYEFKAIEYRLKPWKLATPARGTGNIPQLSIFRGVERFMAYDSSMIRADKKPEFWHTAAVAATACVLAASSCGVNLHADENPYLKIISRNAFGIKPVPPPPAPAEIPKPLEPPKPPSNITLTGLAEYGDGRHVYLVVTKAGAKTPDYLDLREGERQDELEIVSVDPIQETVRIRSDGKESTIDFKTNGNKTPGASALPQPGHPQVSVPGAPAAPNFQGNIPGGVGQQGGGPAVFRRGGGGVMENVGGQFAPGNQPLNISAPALNNIPIGNNYLSLPQGNRNLNGNVNSDGNGIRIDAPSTQGTHPTRGIPIIIPPLPPIPGVPGIPGQ